jgi:uncharacterized RDD family membrane protein YckC
VVCQNCGFPLAPQAFFCQKCGIPIAGLNPQAETNQVFFESTPISPLRRFWSLILDILLFWLTLGFGWVVWAIVLLPKSQTPAKQILGYVLVDHRSGSRPALWRVALRQFLPLGLTVFAFFGPLYVLTYTHEANEDLSIPVGGTLVIALFLLIDAIAVFTRQRRRLFDFFFNTSVVRELEVQI